MVGVADGGQLSPFCNRVGVLDAARPAIPSGYLVCYAKQSETYLRASNKDAGDQFGATVALTLKQLIVGARSRPPAPTGGARTRWRPTTAPPLRAPCNAFR